MPQSNLLQSLVETIKQWQALPYEEHISLRAGNMSLFDERIVIRSEEDYLLAMEIRNYLGAVWCAVSTTSPEFDQIHSLNVTWDTALNKYNKGLEIKDPETKAIAKYLLWHQCYVIINAGDVVHEAMKRSLLYRERNDDGTPGKNVLIVGLNYPVGDNVFRRDSKGREKRVYTKTIGRMGIYLKPYYLSKLSEVDLDSLPLLPENYYPTTIGDAKGSIKGITLSAKEKGMVARLFTRAQKAA